MVRESELGRYVPFFRSVSNDMDDTADAMRSVGTCSLRAVTLIMGRFCVRVSSKAIVAAKIDMRTIAVIATAKVLINNGIF